MSAAVSNWATVLEEQAEKLGEKPFLYLVYEDRYVSYREMNENANRAANFFLKLGAKPGDGVATLMGNSAEFLDVFFGIQKIGMYVVPVNTSLRGDSLAYILDNSDAKFLVVDHDLVGLYRSVQAKLPQVKRALVNTREAPEGFEVPRDLADWGDAYGPGVSCESPRVDIDPESLLLLMYTSGTTGLPKGVVSRYNKNIVDRIRPLAAFMLTPDSVYFTALALFHGNALFITTTQSLIAGCTVALSKKFSASRFWEQVYRSKATIFNTIGAIIPILLKQPESPYEKMHSVKTVLSAGCPADMWERFEKRFGVTLWEGYGAVDGSGTIMNLGNAPKGSVGKPLLSEIRLVDDEGRDVPVGQPGELLFRVPPDKKSNVEYYKNSDATGQKTRGEWEYTGDLLYQDAEGYLYFVGRKTDSMRRRGENVSAFEVEQAILKHPAVLECAVYGVPSELTEEEIMASVRVVEGMRLEPAELLAFLQDKLAKFAVPRYIRVVDDFPRTETFRVKKHELKAIGVTDDTFDAERGS